MNKEELAKQIRDTKKTLEINSQKLEELERIKEKEEKQISSTWSQHKPKEKLIPRFLTWRPEIPVWLIMLIGFILAVVLEQIISTFK